VGASGGVLHWNGSAWTLTHPAGTHTLVQLFALDAAHVYLAGR
jgi:hypothetical protein